MTYQTIDPARITWLRKAKKVMLDVAKSDYAGGNLAFVTRAKKFAARIPHRTNDYFAWSAYSPDGFTIMADELSAEYAYLADWSEKLFRKWQAETSSDLKKETEILTANDKVEPEKVTEIKPEANVEVEKKNLPRFVERGQSKPHRKDMKKETENKKPESYVVAHGNTTHGGRRAGAGRKSIGVKKAVSIVLPAEAWQEIDNLIQNGDFKSNSEYFRWLFEHRPITRRP